MDGDGNMHMSISTNPADGFIQGQTKPMPQISMYIPNNFKKAVHIGIDEGGGRIAVGNKTGEAIITLQADDYGNGEVGALRMARARAAYTSRNRTQDAEDKIVVGLATIKKEKPWLARY